MTRQVLFLQGGGGKEDHEADAKLVASLRKELSEGYVVHYPLLPNESSPDFGREKQIDKGISTIRGEMILVGHSLGASMLLKYLSENDIRKKIAGIFLLATPFWSGEENWKEGLKLNEDFANLLPKDVLIFFYHCEDDEVVSFNDLEFYKKTLPNAIIRKITSGGHQFNNDLSLVAKDIRALQSKSFE